MGGVRPEIAMVTTYMYVRACVSMRRWPTCVLPMTTTLLQSPRWQGRRVGDLAEGSKTQRWHCLDL